MTSWGHYTNRGDPPCRPSRSHIQGEGDLGDGVVHRSDGDGDTVIYHYKTDPGNLDESGIGTLLTPQGSERLQCCAYRAW